MTYGHIGFSVARKSFFAKIIMMTTGSKWSHSFITTPPIANGRLMVLEAANSGVSAIPLDTAYVNDPDEDCALFSVNIADEAKLSAINKAMDKLQTGYGFLELPWFVYRRLCLIIGKDIRGKDNWSQAGIICSELAASYLSDVGLGHLIAHFGKGSINAQDLYEICLANPDLFECALDESK